jgi:hypothetical protein
VALLDGYAFPRGGRCGRASLLSAPAYSHVGVDVDGLAFYQTLSCLVTVADGGLF